MTSSSVGADVRDGLRVLLSAPGHGLVMLLCLTIGSTLTVLAFGIINTLQAGDLPGVHDRGRIIRLFLQVPGRSELVNVSAPELRVLEQERIPGIAAVGGEAPSRGVSAAIDGCAVWASARYVSGSFFHVLGARAVAGRLPSHADDRPGAERVVALSYAFWLRHFAGRTDAVGQSIRIGAHPHIIIGVVPLGFLGTRVGDLGERVDDAADLWLPMAHAVGAADAAMLAAPGAVDNAVVARLEQGIDRQAAEAALQPLVVALGAMGQRNEPGRIVARPFVLLAPGDPRERQAILGLVMLVPLLVLGIASVNVAGVHLARAVGRTHELGIRAALGASRWRIVRLLVIETGIIAMAASLLAWGLAVQLLPLSGRVLPVEANSDWRLFVFSLLLPVLVTMTAGLIPALRATGFDLLAALRVGPRLGRGATPLARRTVLVTQIGLCVALVTVTVFIVRGLENVPHSVGSLAPDVVVADVSLTPLELQPDEEKRLHEQVTRAVAALPGVVAFGVGQPLFDQSNGIAPRPVTSGWFAALGIGFLQGRPFDDRDDDVVVVNESYARRLGGPAVALGQAIELVHGSERAWTRATIVGVVEDAYERALPYRNLPVAYVPMRGRESASFTLYVGTRDAGAMQASLTGTLADVDSRLAARRIGTVAEAVTDRFKAFAMASQALGVVSVMSVVLVAIGLFGAVAHTTQRRSHEFGVRLALGAQRWHLASAVAGEALAISVAGAAAGFLLALPPILAMSQTELKGIDPYDLVPPAVATVLSAAVGLIASAGPVRGALALDPVQALRTE